MSLRNAINERKTYTGMSERETPNEMSHYQKLKKETEQLTT